MSEHLYQDRSLAWKILDRQRQYEELRQPLEGGFAEIVAFTDPGLSSWSDSEGARYEGSRIYEGTPPWALRVMAHGWIGSLISQALPRWFKYLFPEPSMRGIDEVNKWIQQVQDQQYSAYRNSTIYAGMDPFVRGGLSVGSSILMPWEAEDGSIDCEVPHPKENYHGPMDSYHRKYKIDVATAVKRFMGGRKVPTDLAGMMDAPLSYSLLKDYLDGKHAALHEFVRAIYRSDDPILEGQPAKYTRKPWCEFYVETRRDGLRSGSERAEDKAKLLQTDEGGYFAKPHIKWDYEINTNEYYARTPASMAIYDIKTHQELERLGLESAQRRQQPPIWLMKKYARQWTGYPGSVVTYDSLEEAAAEPKTIRDNTDWEVGIAQADRIKRSVERHFHTDFFQMYSRVLAENKGSWPTLGQLIRTEGEKGMLLAQEIGGFSDVLRDLDDVVFEIQERKGSFPEPPPIVQDYFAEQFWAGNDKVRLQVEFVGPLMSVQQESQTLGVSEKVLILLKNYMEVDPLLVHKFRASVQLEKDLEQIGCTQDAITPEPEYQDIRAEIAARAAQERQLEMAGAVAKIGESAGKPIDETSVLGRMGG